MTGLAPHTNSVRRLAGAGIAAALLFWSTVASAQSEPADRGSVPPRADQSGATEESTSSTDRFDDAHRRRLYEEGKLEYSRAALWTALFPGLGNFYARQYFLGGLNASLVGFAAVLIPYGLTTGQPGFSWAGGGLIGAAYISGFTTSYIGVKTFNRRLRRGLRVSRAQRPARRLPDARGVGIQIRF